MPRILITGMSGVGKTTVLKHLRGLGYPCFDRDEPEGSFTDHHGHQHWHVERLNSILDNASREPFFVVGCAEEQASFTHRFEAMILLSAPTEVMIYRILNRGNHAKGQREQEMRQTLQDKELVEPLPRKSCTREIVTTASVSEVIHQILMTLASQGDDKPVLSHSPWP